MAKFFSVQMYKKIFKLIALCCYFFFFFTLRILLVGFYILF